MEKQMSNVVAVKSFMEDGEGYEKVSASEFTEFWKSIPEDEKEDYGDICRALLSTDDVTYIPKPV